jgi:lipid-A-disaccharide synthase
LHVFPSVIQATANVRDAFMSAPTILISAGEASSDMYAARLATALRARTGAQMFGMGGPRMAEAGVELVADYHEVAVVGIAEVLHKIPTVIGVQRRLAGEAARRRPALAILVDSPGTHLGVARRLKNIGVPVGYFIGPQVWAWRAGRVRTIKRLVKRMVVIFPFEEKIYRDAGVPVNFVGHPLVDVVRPTMSRAEFAARHGLVAGRPIAALLPGSRRSEIARNFPGVLDACDRVARDMKDKGVQFVHAAAPGLGADFLAKYARPGLEIKRVEGATYDALAAADCAIVASGTATVEAALLGTPLVVIYRVSRLSAMVLRHMVRTPFIGMVNLIAGRLVAPEFIQDEFEPTMVAAEVRKLLESADARESMKAGLEEVRAKLGAGGAIERAADAFAGMLQNGGSPGN